MLRTTAGVGLAAAMLLAGSAETHAQRGGRGGGGARGGGGGAMRGGGSFGGGGGMARPSAGAYGGGAVRGGAVAGPYGGAGVGARSGGSVVGPAGGTRSAGSTHGSYTTNRGTTIDYGAAGRGGTGPGGVSAGRGVGGVQVTTPGGREVNKVGTAGGIAGPGGNGVGTRAGVTTGSGPGGSFGSAHRGGVAVGPHGSAAAGGRVGTATGPGGTVAGGTRAAAGVGPYGAAAGRTTVARGTGGTYYASRATLAGTGGVVRSNFSHYSAFTPNWYARYPGAWFAAGWTAGRIWSAPAWGTVSSFCSYPAEPIYYEYGENIVYSGDQLVFNGDQEYPAATYYQEATQLADTGRAAQAEPKADDFQPLGVFAMVGEGETKSTNIFQLAVNKVGVIRGNYYNALTDTTDPVYGSVDQKTQRAAWTVGDRKTPVYEAGIANLTRDETTMLVHYAADNSQQFTLVRIQQPEGEPPPAAKQ